MKKLLMTLALLMMCGQAWAGLGTDVLAGWNFTSGWLAAGSTIVDSDTFTLNSNNSGIYKTSVLVAGKRYRISMAGSITAGSITVKNGAGSTTYLSGFGTADFTATSDTYVFLIATTSGATIDITHLSIREVLPTTINLIGAAQPHLGPELMGAAGAFTDSTLWGTPGALGWTIKDGTATAVHATQCLSASDILPYPSNGRTYRVTYQLVSYTDDSGFRVGVGNNITTGARSVPAWYSEDITASNTANSRRIYLSRNSTFTGVVSNLSIREILP